MSDLSLTLVPLMMRLHGVGHPDAALVHDALQWARAAMGQGRADLALRVLEPLAAKRPDDSAVTTLCGFALRQEQRLIEAEQMFAKGAATLPATAFGLAQTRYELGLPAAALFEQAQGLLPDDLDIAKNRAAALAAEGKRDEAEAELSGLLQQKPDWLEGHKGLATLRWTGGAQAGFTDSYAAACRAQPQHAGLWIAYFQTLAQSKNWVAALAVLDAAERHLGQTPAMMVSRFFVASESGDDVTAAALFAQTAAIQGDVINLCRIRYLLRHHRYQEAAQIAAPLVTTRSAPMFWPYMSLIWRLLGDERAMWLDQPDVFIKPMDVDLSAGEMEELAQLLRQLHTAQAPYIEQSVRGGTQTDRSVLLRHEPIIQLARARIMDSVRAYIADLPQAVAGHPLLDTPRTHLLIEGSWSVRLLRQGYNVPHTHPMGWLSAAFYVALPASSQMGPAPAGHIGFGTPPVELGLELPAYRHIEPRVGRVAIFPSTMWHSTVPFDDGERLVIAFDIRTPKH